MIEQTIHPKFRRGKKGGFPTKIFLPLIPVSLLFLVLTNFNHQPKAKKTSTPESFPADSTSGKAKPISVLFKGNSDSPIAKAIGRAEGTRGLDGTKTRAYYGHVDPGNGASNKGSFSYQHGAKTPEAADKAQLDILGSQAKSLVQKAKTMGMSLTVEQAVNGLDLYNQAPAAVIGNGGYLDNLKAKLQEAKTNPKIGPNDVVVEARIESFVDPATKQWNAPGLGNNRDSISHDQTRRVQAVAQALEKAKQNKNEKVSPSSLRVVATALYLQTKRISPSNYSMFYPDLPEDRDPRQSTDSVQVSSFYGS